ncbi:DUF941-domain-containing protein [Backusella circina FSU 941]|nr:DUF941-domain-containing protein [Backusella circina FSU 941]
MELEESDASFWEYLGEGNLNIVIRYQGTDDIYKGKVLRIAKEDDSISKRDSSIPFTQQFSQNIITPLLGSEYVLSVTPIQVTPAFLRAIAHHIEADRPNPRKQKSIDFSLSVAYLMKDLTHFWQNENVITFELKPKWGFKPLLLSKLPKDHQIIKRTKCRFCMHSHYRGLKQTQFCPLDLYSQDIIRRKKALNALLYDSPMEKNLKVLLNSHKIPLDQQDTDSKCAQTLVGSNKNRFLENILNSILASDPILQKLKQLQMNLDELGASEIDSYYKRHKGNVTQYDIEAWKGVVNRYHNRLGLFEKVTFPENEEEELQRIYEFVLSMTFKDCSVMINVKHATEKNPHDKHFIMLEGEAMQYDVKVIDLDMKTISKIPYWHQLDHDITENTLKINLEKECVS